MRVNRRNFIAALGAGSVACRNGDATTPPRNASTPPPAALAGSASAPATPAFINRLTISFSGLVAVVGPNNGVLHGLLVDGKTINTEHNPRLVVPTSMIVSYDGPPPKWNPADYLHTTYVWDVTGNQITIGATPSGRPSALTSLGTVTGRRSSDHEFPARGPEEEDVTWLADIAKVPGVNGRLNSACTDAPDPRSAHTVARVRATRGQLGAVFPRRWRDKVFRFDGGQPYQQALGLAQLTMPLDEDETMTITVTPFAIKKGNAKPIQIVVQPGGTESTIFVSNEPSGETPCADGTDIRRLHHFSAFYKLLLNQVGTPPPPMCVSRSCPACGDRVPLESDWVYCPPAHF